MAAPAQINTLRSTDFPRGLADKGSVDKLFQILNPFLQQVGQTTTAGTALNSNIDGQFAQCSIAKGTAWLPMTLTAPFDKNALGAWPQPSYRIDGTGRLWCRGLVTAASAPSPTGQAIWKFPNPLFAPPNAVSGSGRMLMLPCVANGFAYEGFMRADVLIDQLAWVGFSAAFGSFGKGAWNNLTLATNVIGTLSYRLDADGIVWICGNVGTSTGGFVSGFTVGTLPAGFRPAVAVSYPAEITDSGGTWRVGVIAISTGGVVTLSWQTGAIQISGCPLGHVNFDTGADSFAAPSSISYAVLDAISWDTQGGPSLSTRPGFPFNIRLKDGKKPVAVLCWAVNDDSNAVETCCIPAWSYNGSGNTGNTLTINAVNDLRDDVGYTLNFFIFF